MSIKFRVRELPNGKYICELKRWWHGWRAVEFFRYTTGHSLNRGSDAISICTYSPNDSHYSTCWKGTHADAEKVRLEALSILGYAKS